MTIPSSIRCEKSVGEILEELAGQGETNTIRYFNSMAEGMVFAALIGKKYGLRKPIQQVRESPIKFEIFEGSKLDSYIYLIGVADSESLDILNDENMAECFETFEQYAHGGLLVINDWMQEKNNGLMEAILNEMSSVAFQESRKMRESRGAPVVIKKRRKLGTLSLKQS